MTDDKRRIKVARSRLECAKRSIAQAKYHRFVDWQSLWDKRKQAEIAFAYALNDQQPSNEEDT